jgi:hypothetical protein
VRSRNVKPGFFQNEQLAELPFEARLLFIGLWCMADREGRLEDRPKRIKMQVFPADSLDVEPLLAGLERQGLIERYEAHGIECIQIPAFLEHQHPHPNEQKSTLPPRTSNLGSKSDTPRSVADGLIPSSLIPESPIPPDGGFDDFWQAYPKKIRKAAAMRAWLRKGLSAKSADILAHLAERVRSDAQWLAEDGRYIPHPATWLNGDGWLDEYQRGNPEAKRAFW